MGELIQLDDYRPHDVSKVTCDWCGHLWIAVYPSETVDLECPKCEHIN